MKFYNLDAIISVGCRVSSSSEKHLRVRGIGGGSG
ncbi:MAG: hypothetical protein ACR2PW_08755 [Gammaproteobacteria bacterium]